MLLYAISEPLGNTKSSVIKTYLYLTQTMAYKYNNSFKLKSGNLESLFELNDVDGDGNYLFCAI